MELPNNPLRVIWCIHPLLHVPLPLLTHPLTERCGGGLEVVVWLSNIICCRWGYEAPAMLLPPHLWDQIWKVS